MEKHYRHSNTEVGTTDPETGKTIAWKVCDICGREQHSNYGFTVSFDMPGSTGAETHGYCTRCANQLVPILLDALDTIHDQERTMRRKAPPAESHIDKTAFDKAMRELLGIPPAAEE